MMHINTRAHFTTIENHRGCREWAGYIWGLVDTPRYIDFRRIALNQSKLHLIHQ